MLNGHRAGSRDMPGVWIGIRPTLLLVAAWTGMWCAAADAQQPSGERCSRPAPGSAIPEPQDLRSHNGVLEVDLTVQSRPGEGRVLALLLRSCRRKSIADVAIASRRAIDPAPEKGSGSFRVSHVCFESTARASGFQKRVRSLRERFDDPVFHQPPLSWPGYPARLSSPPRTARRAKRRASDPVALLGSSRGLEGRPGSGVPLYLSVCRMVLAASTIRASAGRTSSHRLVFSPQSGFTHS